MEVDAFTRGLVAATSKSPVYTLAIIYVFRVMINGLEAQMERMIFGNRFEHNIDIVISAIFIVYSAYAVWACSK